jgi:hypothetical protein
MSLLEILNFAPVTTGPLQSVLDRRLSSGQEHPREWRARPRAGLGLPRMPPASGVHTSTNGHRILGLGSRIAGLVSKGRCRAIWKNREKRKSSRRKSCDYRCRLAQCCSSRRDKTPSWVCLSRLQVARRVRCGVYAARQVHYCYRPSALTCPLPSLGLRDLDLRCRLRGGEPNIGITHA